MAAALLRFNFNNYLYKTTKILSNHVHGYGRLQKKVKRSERLKIHKIELQPVAESIKSRGFLRNMKAYNPPADACEKLDAICSRMIGTTDRDFAFDHMDKRCLVLNECRIQFDYKVPNSILHTIKTIGDLESFYTSPINTTNPYDSLKNLDLPPNLHIQFDYHRFHPDTDTLFNGVTAFPKSSTLISGLRSKEKYKGHKQQSPFHDI